MGRKYHEPIPKDFPVRPTKKKGAEIATCYYCNLSWDDSKVTSYTPVPSARCPFEYFHIHKEQ